MSTWHDPGLPPLGSRRWAPNPWTPKPPLSTSPRRITSPRSSERTPHSACSRADPSTLAGPTRSLNRSRVPHTLFARALALSIVFYPPSTTPRRVLRELSLRMLPFSVLSAPFSGRLCLQHPCVYLCSRPVCHPCLWPVCPHRTRSVFVCSVHVRSALSRFCECRVSVRGGPGGRRWRMRRRRPTMEPLLPHPLTYYTTYIH